MTDMISLRNINVNFPSPSGDEVSTIFENFDLRIEKGAFTVLLGPSGCGKSTLLNLINGLQSPNGAEAIEVEGRDIRAHPNLTRDMGYVFQNARLLKWKTLRKNVEFGLKGLNLQPRDRWAGLIERYFGAVGLGPYMDFYPHQVSGGMRQRVSIIRAWANEPQILLMDEPFSHLDEITAGELRLQLVELWERELPRRTIIFVTHDISEAVALGTHLVVLTDSPTRVCHEERLGFGYPRRRTDERIFSKETALRRIFAERAHTRI